MIISPSKEFIFIHLEKCGGTSVESALEPHLAWHDMIIGSSNFGEEFQKLYFDKYGVEKVKKEMLWKHSDAKQIEYFLGTQEWNDFKKFAIVRDPVELVKSFYNFSQTVVKYHMGNINRGLWKEKLRTHEFSNMFPLTEGYVLAYIQSVIDAKGIDGFTEIILKSNYHFISPQTNRLIATGMSDLQNVFELSKLNEQWDEITKLMGIENKIKLSHLNSSENSGEELSSRSIKKIKKHFAIDYDVLPKYTGVYWK